MRVTDRPPIMPPTVSCAANCSNLSCSNRIDVETLHGTERLVGIGFRCWINGYQNTDIGCWEHGWNVFARELGPERARTAITELAGWIRSICSNAEREIAVCAVDRDRFCKDECIAVSMIAACQHNACPALEACALALLGADLIEPVLETSTRFARTLQSAEIHLADSAIEKHMTFEARAGAAAAI